MVESYYQYTYQQVFDIWWPDYQEPLRETTRKSMWEIFRVHVLPYFGNRIIASLSPKDAQDFVALKRQHGSQLRHPGPLSDWTVHKLAIAMMQPLRWALNEGHITENPLKIRIPVPTNRREINVFTSEEVHTLMEVARPKWMAHVIALAFYTGMRRAEIFGLKWQDIDFRQGFLMIRRSVTALEPGQRNLGAPKTRGSARRIQIGNPLIDILNDMKAVAKSEWVIENQYGKPISPWYVTKYMHAACVAAGIPKRSIHALRHTHATILLGANVHPRVVQERLGHSDIQMTLSVYSHVLPTMQQAAVDVFSEL